MISAEHGTGLEELRDAIYQFLNVIRVYTKQPGKPRGHDVAVHVPDRQHGGRVGGLRAPGLRGEAEVGPRLGHAACSTARPSDATTCCTIRMWWSCICDAFRERIDILAPRGLTWHPA